MFLFHKRFEFSNSVKTLEKVRSFHRAGYGESPMDFRASRCESTKNKKRLFIHLEVAFCLSVGTSSKSFLYSFVNGRFNTYSCAL